MDWIPQDPMSWIAIVVSLYATLATIAAATPTDKDDAILDRVGNLLRAIGILPPKAGK